MAYTQTDLAEADLKIFQAKRTLVEQRERLESAKGQGQLKDSANALLLSLETALANLLVSREMIADSLNRQRR